MGLFGAIGRLFGREAKLHVYDEVFRYGLADTEMYLVPPGSVDEIWKSGKAESFPTNWKFAQPVRFKLLKEDDDEVYNRSVTALTGQFGDCSVECVAPLDVDGSLLLDDLRNGADRDMVILIRNDYGFSVISVYSGTTRIESSVRHAGSDGRILHCGPETLVETLRIHYSRHLPYKRLHVDVQQPKK